MENPLLPLLWLDVDGVLNSSKKRGAFPDVRRHKVYDEISGLVFDLHLSRQVGTALAARPVEIRWLTTWMHQADTRIASLVGLPRGLTVAGQRKFTETGSDWKRRAVLEEAEASRRPFIWADDDAHTVDALLDLSEAWVPPHLLITTDEDVGLTPEDFERIDAFLAMLDSPTGTHLVAKAAAAPST